MAYRDLADYITQRARVLDHTLTSLSEALGFGRSYISSVVNFQFQPSQKRCRQIAAFFDDDPNIILALAGYYEPPKAGDPFMSDIEQAARSLPAEMREELLHYAHYLKGRSAPYSASTDAESEEADQPS